MNEIATETVKVLVNAGSLAEDDNAALELLSPIKNKDYINRLHWEKWRNVTNKLSINELIALVKSLVLAEYFFRWAGGSVSSVIWTYREVERRDRETANVLADWVLQRTHNPYAPFGSQNYGAKSLPEYQKLSEKHRDKINIGIQDQKESEIVALKSRQERDLHRKNSIKYRNTELRDTFIESLSKKSLIEQLIQLAYDEKYSVEFYPTQIANRAKYNFLETLDEELRILLLEKLKGKHKGPWGKLKRNLLEIYQEKFGWRSTPWNRKPWF